MIAFVSFIASLTLLQGIVLRTMTNVRFLGLDNHELAHFFGAFGLVTLLIISLAREIPMRQANTGLAGLMALIGGLYAANAWFAPYLERFHIPAAPIVGRYLLLVVAFAMFLRLLGIVSRFLGYDGEGRWPMVLVLAIPVCYSMGWELVWQPFFEVYGADARGYVQGLQFLADQVACVLALLVTCCFCTDGRIVPLRGNPFKK